MFIIWNFGDLLCNSLSDDFSSITNEKVSFNKSCLDNIKIEDFYKTRWMHWIEDRKKELRGKQVEERDWFAWEWN